MDSTTRPEIHTLLLVPPSGDTTLLADEAGGGRVPTMWERPARVGYGGHGKRPAIDMPARWCLPNSLSGQPWGVRVSVRRALLLVYNGAPVAMGIDRAYRVARPVHDRKRQAFEAIREARAKLIYAAYPGAEKHPWIEGGSSGRQHDARYEAFNALIAEGVEPVEGVSDIMEPTYAIQGAVRIAKWAADLLGAKAVALSADGQEVTPPTDTTNARASGEE